MANVEANISMSLDGFVTGPNLDQHPGLGEGGDILHAWTEESRAMDSPSGRSAERIGGPIALERAEVIESRHATHPRYRVRRQRAGEPLWRGWGRRPGVPARRSRPYAVPR